MIIEADLDPMSGNKTGSVKLSLLGGPLRNRMDLQGSEAGCKALKRSPQTVSNSRPLSFNWPREHMHWPTPSPMIPSKRPEVGAGHAAIMTDGISTVHRAQDIAVHPSLPVSQSRRFRLSLIV